MRLGVDFCKFANGKVWEGHEPKWVRTRMSDQKHDFYPPPMQDCLKKLATLSIPLPNDPLTPKTMELLHATQAK